MRTATILIATALLLGVIPGRMPHAGGGGWDDLTPESQAAYLKYEDETIKRLQELDIIVERPGDDPELARNIWRDICEEDDVERATAYETSLAAEAGDDDGDDDIEWIESMYEEYRVPWAYLRTQGAVWYARVCDMHVRHENVAEGEAYYDVLMRFFDTFADPVDAAADDGYRALPAGMIEEALIMCRVQLPIAKMLDDVWYKYEEKFTEFIKISKEDEFGDHEAWWADWELDPEEDHLFCSRLENWQRCVKERYEENRQKEIDAEDLMERVVDGRFMDGKYKRIDEWFEDDLGVGMAALIRDLEKAEKEQE